MPPGGTEPRDQTAEEESTAVGPHVSAEGDVLVVRPGGHRLGAFGPASLPRWQRASRAWAGRSAPATILLEGVSAEVFCAGVDLTALAAMAPAEAAEFMAELAGFLFDWAQLPCPTVAAVAGKALGSGADLALASDVCLATDTASFRFPGMQFGVVLGSRRLEHMLGGALARRLVLLGEAIPATTLGQLGVVELCSPTRIGRLAAHYGFSPERVATLLPESCGDGTPDARGLQGGLDLRLQLASAPPMGTDLARYYTMEYLRASRRH